MQKTCIKGLQTTCALAQPEISIHIHYHHISSINITAVLLFFPTELKGQKHPNNVAVWYEGVLLIILLFFIIERGTLAKWNQNLLEYQHMSGVLRVSCV